MPARALPCCPTCRKAWKLPAHSFGLHRAVHHLPDSTSLCIALGWKDGQANFCSGISLFQQDSPVAGKPLLERDSTGDVVGSLCCPRFLMPFCIEWLYNLKQTYGVIFRGWGREATNQKVLQFSKGASKLSASRRACEGYTCCWLGSPWWLKFYFSPCVFPLGIFVLWSLLYLAMYCKHTPVVLSHVFTLQLGDHSSPGWLLVAGWKWKWSTKAPNHPRSPGVSCLCPPVASLPWKPTLCLLLTSQDRYTWEPCCPQHPFGSLVPILLCCLSSNGFSPAKKKKLSK